MLQSEFDRRVLLRAHELLNLFTAGKEAIEEIQRDEIVKLAEYAINRSTWWADRLRQLRHTADWQQLGALEILNKMPTTTRVDLQNHFEDMIIHQPNLTEENLLTTVTSGSTGQPVKTKKIAANYRSNYQSMTIFDWLLHELDPNARVLRLVYGAQETTEEVLRPLHLLGSKTKSILRNPSNLNAEELLEIISTRKPKYTLGTLAPLVLAARYAKANSINAKGILECVISGADPVNSEDRDLISEVFGATISNRYSCEEIGYIAVQCPAAEHLHVIAPNVILEILDKNGNQCKSGETGQVFVTQLRNLMMPIFRYWLGDYAVVGEKCGLTNWPAIQEISGRVRQQLLDEKTGQYFIPVLGNLDAIKEAPLLEYQIFLFEDAICFVYRANDELPVDHQTNISVGLKSRLRRDLPVFIWRSNQVNFRQEYKKKTFEKIESSIKRFQDADSILNRNSR